MGRTARRRAKQYSTFAGPKGKATGAQFKAYVDTDAGLKRAWAGIQNPKTAQDRKNKEYWELRGATSKEAFGRAHAAEDEALRSGTYPQGDTKRTVGSKEWKEKYADGTTRFEDYLRDDKGDSGGGGGGGGDSGGGGGGDPDGGILGPYPEQNIYFPMLDTAYTAPNAQDWSAYMQAGSPFTGGAQARYPQAVFPPEWGTDTPYANSSNPLFNQGPPPEPAGGSPNYATPGLLYQPWSTEYQQAFVPGNLWNYVPPELNVGAPQYSSGGHMSVSDSGGSGGGDPPGKKPPWWVTDPQDGADAELVDAWRQDHTPGWPGLLSGELYGPGDWDLLGEDYSIPSDGLISQGAYKTQPGFEQHVDWRSGSFPVAGPQKTGMSYDPTGGSFYDVGAIDVTGATKGKGR